MQVLKFGGSSVANAENINKVVAIVKDKVATDKTAVVVSALGGITDVLLGCSALAAAGDEAYKDKLQEAEQRHLQTVKELLPLTQQSGVLSMVKTLCNEIEDICNGIFLLKELSEHTKDRIVSYGEILSSQIIAAKLKEVLGECEWIDSREIITTDSNFGSAAVDFAVTDKKVAARFAASSSKLFMLPGFISSNEAGEVTTLGRGGSDYTAAILAAALDAHTLEIWTDVSGMMTADPRLVTNVKMIPRISYQEAMELSHFGAKVIYPPTIQPVLKKGIPTWIKNTFAPEDIGTVIEKDAAKDDTSIRGISSIGKITLLSLEGSGMVGIPGFSKRLFGALANAKINVILITQSSSEHSICVGIDDANAALAKKIVDEEFSYEIETSKVEPLGMEREQAIVAVVGDNMRSHPGISGKMFGTLGRNGVNVRAISQGSSERNISAVIGAKDVKKAINVLHEAFFETTYKEINLFVAGVGNVGGKLLAQLHKQQGYLQKYLRIKIKVTGIANSTKMLFNDDGIDLENWKEVLLKDGAHMTSAGFIKTIIDKNVRNSVFADVTANGEIAELYDRLLEKSISVVACNKIAASSSFEYFKNLKELANEFNTSFLYETNVGASLPVIGTLNDLIRSGDKVRKIEAVLSGTLNFVFNNYKGAGFSEVVMQAKKEGYTEPDPRLDLSGKDVMRKILILARECGAKMELDDITNNSFMPEECMVGSVDDFFKSMVKHEVHFKKLYDEAASKGNILKFVAKYENGKASVGLQHIHPEHDLFHLYGKDNIVLFYTDRYVDQPLVIKGAGAGAEVTASGVFADIIRASRA